MAIAMLSGSATMAKLKGIADVAAGLERLSRFVREGKVVWDELSRGVAIAAVDEDGLAGGITGEIVHVDGGLHSTGA